MAFVGGGPRASIFVRQALTLNDRFEVVGVTSRSSSTRATVHERFGVRTFESIEELSASRPDFVVVAINRDGAAQVTAKLAHAGLPVLVETPPAADDVGALRAMWSDLGPTGLVQVAEQSVYMPSHLAKRAAVETGLIGRPIAVQVSSNHGYHAVALIRSFLGRTFQSVAVRSTGVRVEAVNAMRWDQWNRDTQPRELENTIATIDFGDAVGVYDFTDLQWFDPARHRRLVIRGSHGEIDGDSALRLAEGTVVESFFNRRQLGIDMNFEGFDLDHITLDGKVLYKNPYVGHRLSDEAIAASHLLDAMAAWVQGAGPEPYPLAAGSQDHLIALAIDESKRTGTTVSTDLEAWAHDQLSTPGA